MMMLFTRNSFTRKMRFFPALLFCNPISSAATAAAATTYLPDPHLIYPQFSNWEPKEVANSFKFWFKSRNNPSLDRIYQILCASSDEDQASRFKSDMALSQLGLRLTESLVLEVFNYCDNPLCCVKFFDWAGRQPGFYHTRVTFNAVFKILSRGKSKSLLMEFLENYIKYNWHKDRFYTALVMGYAIAGKPEISLHLLGKMRFQGQDLDPFAYNVLLNALVEDNCFDVAEVILRQMEMHGYMNEFARSVVMRSFCKQKRLDEAEEFFRRSVNDGMKINGHGLSFLVDALCKNNDFEHAGKLVCEFGESGCFKLKPFYGVWITRLVEIGRLNEALKFLRKVESNEGYIPELLRYNMLIHRLLKQNRLEEVCDLLMEMKEFDIMPDKATMNAALCFFCKAGMVKIALDLYNSRSEFRLTPSSLVYNYLINTLCGDGSIDEAFHVLKNSMDQGYFCGQKTFSILANLFFREGKLDKMKDLIVFALNRNFMPNNSTYDKFISALCRDGKVEDAYLIHGELNRLNKDVGKNSYANMIYSFSRLSRGDIAARLLLEMQEKGHQPSRELFRDVICCLCCMDNPEKQFAQLLQMQLSQYKPDLFVYNSFIDGAGHAKKPDLAKEVFELMLRSGFTPNVNSDILMLQSLIKNGKISDALNFFNEDVSRRRMLGRKLYNVMISGLSKVNRPDHALGILVQAREKGLRPSLECYEELIKSLCAEMKYDAVIRLINDMEQMQRPISSFIGNTLLFHSRTSKDLYNAWVQFRDLSHETASSSCLRNLLAEFSAPIRADSQVEDLEAVIEQCFPLDIYTYNLMLRKLTEDQIDAAYELFNRFCQKGYEPNKWTFDIMAHGFYMHGRINEARIWVEEVFRRGLEPTERMKSHL